MTEDPKDTSGRKSFKKLRSPAYPMFSLESAIERAARLWESQRKNAAHFDSVIEALGYNAVSGTAQRAVGALGHYGLIEDEGKKNDRKIRLSELALDLLQLGKDDERYRVALRAAALNPAIHQALWDRYGVSLPSDDKILPFLRRDKGYGDAAASDVITNYRLTFEFANLGEEEDNGLDDKDPPEVDSNRGGQPQNEPTHRGFFQIHQPPAKQSPMTQELPILVDHGQIARIPFPMSEDAYDLLLGTLQLWKKKLVPPASEHPKPGDEESMTVQKFPAPINAVWKNKDHDKPVRIVALMKSPGIPDHYQTEDGTGIPASEVEFS